MYKGKVKVFVILFLAAVFLLAGNACQQNPARKPGEKDLNKKLAQKYEKEPTIKLYVKDKDEVKSIKLEEYIKGVVAGEMETEWPQNALAAQAILARTFTLKKMGEGGVEDKDADASTDPDEFQAYKKEKIDERIEKAVQMTKGEVATYKGNLINAWFHADGGGKTAASAKEGLNYDEEEAPYIKSVKDPGFSITDEKNRSWTAEFPVQEVQKKITGKTGKDVGEITDAQVVSKGPSGRATEIQLGTTTVKAPQLRLALDKKEMRSTLIQEMKVQDNKLIIKGKGYGHGVGMSQWGARKLAEEDKSPEKIVKYFFKNIDIVELYE